MVLIIEIAIALILKHFVVDYLFNPIFGPSQKHIYGSRGSLFHSGFHMVSCLFVLLCFISFEFALLAAIFDGLTHYHIDYIKAKILQKYKKRSKKFKLTIMVLDQCLHVLNYVIIIVVLIKETEGWKAACSPWL